VVITTAHDAYQWKKILEMARMVVDTRNALGAEGKLSPKVIRL
jgi:UDP-N-acetyl-D-mannosaminuronate dehydrogenase